FWSQHADRVLSTLCQMLLDRRLFKIIVSDQPFAGEMVREIEQHLLNTGVKKDELSYFLVEGVATNSAYLPSVDNINIKLKDDRIIDIADASDLPGIKALTNMVRRYYVCWAKNLAQEVVWLV